MPSLVWFRRDLRVLDNSALFHAAQEARDGVIGLFIITPQQWQQHDDAASKIKFWLQNLGELSADLARINVSLQILTCDSFEQVPSQIASFAKKQNCETLYLNREYEVNEVLRDQQVTMQCEQSGITVRAFHDRVIVPPDEIKTNDGRFYSVFTPYRRVWETKALDFIDTFAKLKKQTDTGLPASKIPTKISGFDFSEFRSDLWKPGETEAHSRLKKFARIMAAYDEARDIPSKNGTSLLSPYLAAGVISPRQCLTAALTANGGKIKGDTGPATWISELAWRDFYTHVLVGFPRVSKHQPFKLKTNALKWRTSDSDFAAWQQGQTGYPIVDAGMRQLNQTGWMHNRLRMVTAMFLTKHLLVDWRRGEKHFMQQLVDGDLAANNGGWQWSASTGTDSVPYFRIFNPFSQSKRFDPEGKFIKKFCPELAEVSESALHDPKKLTAAIKQLKLDYPPFVVDHATARQRALDAFKSIK
jgi:deoxyribodipyrimidine photo-lyase